MSSELLIAEGITLVIVLIAFHFVRKRMSKMGESIQIPETIHPGIREHFLRAVLFYDLGVKTSDSANGFRALMAAVYSCRAIAELMFEQSDKGRLTVGRDELKELLVTNIPFFNLVERIRIHDFHRYGLFPPNPQIKTVSGRGPMKLTASQGVAEWHYTPEGPKTTLTGNSKFKGQRPLFDVNGAFFDEDTETHVELRVIIPRYLRAIPNAVAEFEKLLTSEGRNAHPTPELFPHLYGLDN